MLIKRYSKNTRKGVSTYHHQLEHYFTVNTMAKVINLFYVDFIQKKNTKNEKEKKIFCLKNKVFFIHPN